MINSSAPEEPLFKVKSPVDSEQQPKVACPNCLGEGMAPFYVVEHTPVNSMLLLHSREEALHFPTGRIRLGFCHSCGFISNLDFDPEIVEYSPRYEATQSYSPSFNAYLSSLAEDLVQRFSLRGKQVIEIGCGQGEFLTKICEIGDNQGTGFDPAFTGKLKQMGRHGQIRFVQDFFSEKYAPADCDFLVCRMTLEHIRDTNDFVRMLHKSIGTTGDPLVFFQVPNAGHILRELAFWDIYYEHSSYFVAEALDWLFRECGFDVLSLIEDYEGQYLNIVARKGGNRREKPEQESCLKDLVNSVVDFQRSCRLLVQTWRERINLWRHSKRLVIWGASSKGVSFINMLDIRDEIPFVVDINPKKQGTFLPGTGQEIIPPERLQDYQPEIVILMNPIYGSEVRNMLAGLNLQPQLVTL